MESLGRFAVLVALVSGVPSRAGNRIATTASRVSDECREPQRLYLRGSYEADERDMRRPRPGA